MKFFNLIKFKSFQKWNSILGIILLTVLIICCDVCNGKSTSPKSKTDATKNKHQQTKPQGRNAGEINLIDSENGRIRKSPKYTEETLAIGRESYNNLLIYEAKKTGGSSKPKGISNRHPLCNKPKISCDSTFKHRRIDGRCNNLKRIDWGASFTTFARLVPAEYADGFNKPKGEPPHKPLPNPRFISATIHSEKIVVDPTLTNMVPQMGQFVDHDITLAPEGDRRCCTTEKDGIDCWPITIPANDKFYSSLSDRQTCMDFTRSTAFCFPTASTIREQFNIVTAFLDASHTYGSDDERSKFIREFKGGRLLYSDEFPDLKLPPSVDQISKIQKRKIRVPFLGKFMAGDNRVNETPGLTVMHTLFIREHNRLAADIIRAKSKWDDEKIYQEARRINIAQWQNIVFAHFLPKVFGDEIMRKYKLDLGEEDDFSEYDSSLDPTIYHSFATAAYRFGHSMVNGLYRLFKGDNEVGSFQIRHNFFNSNHIETSSAMDVTLNGLMLQNSQLFDRFVAEDLGNFLFKGEHEDFGSDLLARNIRRGRDHGLANYNTYRQICGLETLTKWDDRPSEIESEAWKKLKEVYELPSDIELFPGGLSEKPVKGAVTGPTFNCLKAMQFYVLKFGDRFFFTHKNQAGSFTSKQLQILRRRTLGDVICENSALQKTTLDVFKIKSKENPWINCADPKRQGIRVKDFIQ